ncbi:MAG: hypothetical protein LBK73_01065 [Treponema sp.]|nr:hypothetical protein [Treponema sp.]
MIAAFHVPTLNAGIIILTDWDRSDSDVKQTPISGSPPGDLDLGYTELLAMRESLVDLSLLMSSISSKQPVTSASLSISTATRPASARSGARVRKRNVTEYLV